MGIGGLETFVDSLYKESKISGPFREISLEKIQLVIDGNQLPHVICKELYTTNEYSGNYDQLYSVTKSLLTALKPFIEIIIFDGSKEDSNKAMKRFEQKIERIANLKTRFYPMPSKDNHLKELQKCPPLFVRMIVFKVVNELNIKYTMADGMADHAVACYANGMNKTRSKFTVLSRDSYFYAYNLDKGYICMKYFIDYLREPNKLNGSTKVPIFILNNLLGYLRLQNYKTWLYFCVILGDRDIDLAFNLNYLRTNRIDTRNGNLIRLVNHLQSDEMSSLVNNFKNLRSFYDRDQLKSIDDLIAMFEFKDIRFKLTNSIQPNDFDRFILSVKDLRTCYLYTGVEDCTDNNIFKLCQDNHILEQIYFCLNNQIVEYSRNIIKTDDEKNIIKKYIFNAKDFQANNSALSYLGTHNVNNSNEKDDLTLFYVSLAIWYQWLKQNNYNNKIEFNNPDDFLDSVLYNWIIISLKSGINASKTQSALLMQDCFKQKEDYSEIIQLYEQIVGNKLRDNYFSSDLKLVHRINEFQAAYFALSIYSKLKQFMFDFLTPDQFFNGLFICTYLQENKKRDSKSFKLFSLLSENKTIQNVMQNIRKDFFIRFNRINSSSNSDELSDLIQSIKIN